MITRAIALACVAFTLSCGSSEPRYSGNTRTNPVCKAGEIKKEACADGKEGSIVTVCSDQGSWQEASNTCKDTSQSCVETTFIGLKPILTEKCVRCHQGYDQYATAKSKINSFITRVNLPSSDVRSMPRGGSLSGAEKDTLTKWKADGLLEKCKDTANFGGVTLDAIESKILEDLTGIDPVSRQFIRYFMVRNNDKSGVTKAVNATSLANSIHPVEMVDEKIGLGRIDIEDFDFTRNDWVIIEKNDDINFESFSSKGQLIKVLTQTRKPWLHDRNFSFISHKTAVYYHLLKIPQNFQSFLNLEFINLNIQNEFARLKPRLIGFNGSPITGNKNRLIGRYESEEGYLWLTYDVLNVNQAGKNLFEDPLIADAGGAAQYLFDGSEAIFTLPNGMQGYALFDGQGKRVDEAPVNLVFDTESPFDPVINNGLDCHRCHAAGVLAAEDQIRDHVTRNAGQFTARDVQLVQFLFPNNELPLFNIDNAKYKVAMDAVGQKELDAVNEGTDYLRTDYKADKIAELLFVTVDQLLACINQSAQLQAQIGQVLSGGTVTFEQLTQSLPTIFNDCGFNQELFYP